MFPAFRRHRLLKVLAVVLAVGAFAYAKEIIVPFVEARSKPFEECFVYYISGSDFIRITDSNHGVYSVSDGRESFEFNYKLGTYFCKSGEAEWKMRLTDDSNLYDQRSSQWFWGSAI